MTSKYGLDDELGGGLNKFGGPQARPGEKRDGAGLAGVAELGRHGQLGAARVFSADWPFVCRGEQQLFDFLPDWTWIRADRWAWAGRKKPRLDGGSYLTAIDYKTGKAAWRHRYYSDWRGGGGS